MLPGGGSNPLTHSREQPAAFQVGLPDGVTLPFSIIGPDFAPLRLVVGHGLGEPPSTKTHLDDVATTVVEQALSMLQPPELGPGESAPGACRALAYTARGHGKSRGWKAAAKREEHNTFLWDRLSADMLQVAYSHGLDKFIAVGQSMGGASALYAALQAPDRVAALVVMRPPTCGETRVERRAQMLRAADKLRVDGSDGDATVLAGAAAADLDCAAFAALRCPVLILAHGADDGHPLSTARQLRAAIGETARLEEAADLDAAKEAWPAALAGFLRGLP